MKTQNIITFWVLKSQKKEKALPFIYWISKKHQNPTGARFIIASKISSTKQISNFFYSVMSSSSCTPKLNISIKKLNSYQIILRVAS